MTQLNMNEDSLILIKFTGKGSAMFEVHPSNVSPAQMLMVSEVLKIQAQQLLERDHDKAVIKAAILELQNESENSKSDIAVAKGQVLRP